MFNRLKKNFGTRDKQQKELPEEEVNTSQDEADTTGFLCPICMAALPGPAELQQHFERVHSENAGIEGDVADGEEQTDALPDRSQEELLTNSPKPDFQSGHLELTIDSNAPDEEKEHLLLQQELAEVNSQLKEEKWYSGQLKIELEKVSKERDKLEEDKHMIESEFSSQLRSAEEGYLQVAKENESLKKELTYADYNTTKERQEKMRQEMVTYQNDLDEERLRRSAMEESFQLLKNDYAERQKEIAKMEEQLKQRPSDDIVLNLNSDIEKLKQEIEEVKIKHRTELADVKETLGNEYSKLKEENMNIQMVIKELTLEKNAKVEQIASLQTAVATSTEATTFSKEQLNVKQQQIIELRQNISRLESSFNEKIEVLSKVEKEKVDLALDLKSQVSEKEVFQKEIHSLKRTLEESQHQIDLTQSNIKDLEKNLGKEKEEVVRLEKERIELIAKIEAGEGTDTVIQQLSSEKTKLLETVSSMEKSLSEQMKQHTNELDIVRKEKLTVQEELHSTNIDLSKVKTNFQDVEKKYEVGQESISNLEKKLQEKTDECFKLESHISNERTEFNSKIEDLSNVKTKQETDIKILEEKLAKVQEDLKKGDKTQAQQASWIDTKNNAIAEMTSRISSFQEQLTQKNIELAATQKELEARSLELNNVKESSQKSIEENEKHMQELTETLSKDLRDKDEALKKISSEKVTLEESEKTFQQIKGELEKEIENKSSMILQLQETNKSNLIEKEKVINEMQVKQGEAKSKHSTELSHLQEQMQDETKKLQDLQTNMDEEIKKRNQVENEILSLETKYNQLESILEQKDEVLNEVQNKLEIAEKELNKPCDSCKNYEIQLCRLQEATRDQSGQIAKLNTNIEAVQEELRTSQENKKSIQADFDQCKKEFEESSNELKSQICVLEEDKSKKIAEMENLMDELKEVKGEVETLTNEKFALEGEVASCKETNEQHTIDKDNLEKEILDLKADVEVKKNKFKELETKMAEEAVTFEEKIQSHIQEKEDIEMKLKNECEAHVKTKTSSSAIQEAMKQDSVLLQNKLDKALYETEDERQRKAKLETTLRKEMERFQDQIKKQEQENVSKQRRISEFEMRVTSLEKETNELKGDITVLEAQLQNSNEEKKALLERLLEADDQHKKTKQKLSDTNRRLDQALSGLQELGQENQNIQVQQAIKSNRQWQSDSEVTSCKKCEKLFSLTNRKHHCRNCGCIFCKECTSWNAIVASSKKPVRVCESCSMELSNVRGSQVRRLSTSSVQSSASVR